MKYETGQKKEVLSVMAQKAIKWEISLIDAITPQYGEPDKETAKAIADCRAAIRDYKKITG